MRNLYPTLYNMTETVQTRPASLTSLERLERFANIYAIFSVANNKVYYGATCRKLNERFRDHKGNGNRTRSRDIMAQQDVEIELVRSIEYTTKQELRAKEYETIKAHGNSKWATFQCVNFAMPGRTSEQYRIDNRANIYSRLSAIVNCDVCGCTSSVRNIARHNKSKRHLANQAN
jgi:predicted GIY-YIG superfamily endonuclease